MNLSFKKCSSSDLKVLIDISISTFTSAFEKENNPDDFKAYINAAFSKKKINSELLNPHSLFYFIYDDHVLVGYFKLNEKNAQNEQFNKATIELERLYILKKHQGKSIGNKALLEIKEIAKAKKVHFLWLGVWEHNHNAQKFYERHGFKKFGTHPYMLGNDKQTDWLMKFEFF
ncbi:MAG: GNAT family N-acetyltransferase [Flavobacteriaceae bacterium]|nr:GNAT family N-acetyltransferase [Flavobacteriaceae bacterium]